MRDLDDRRLLVAPGACKTRLGARHVCVLPRDHEGAHDGWHEDAVEFLTVPIQIMSDPDELDRPEDDEARIRRIVREEIAAEKARFRISIARPTFPGLGPEPSARTPPDNGGSIE